MTRTYSRTRKLYANTVYKLAVGEGDARSRLRSVYRDIRSIGDGDLPVELLADHIWIVDQMTKFGGEVGPDGTVYKTALENTMARIRNSTARKIAERIVSVNRTLSS